MENNNSKNSSSKYSTKEIGGFTLIATILGFCLNLWQITDGCSEKPDDSKYVDYNLPVVSAIDSFGLELNYLNTLEENLSSKLQLIGLSIIEEKIPIQVKDMLPIIEELLNEHGNDKRAAFISNSLMLGLARRDLKCCPEVLHKVNTDQNWIYAWEELSKMLQENDFRRKDYILLECLVNEVKNGSPIKLAIQTVIQ